MKDSQKLRNIISWFYCDANPPHSNSELICVTITSLNLVNIKNKNMSCYVTLVDITLEQCEGRTGGLTECLNCRHVGKAGFQHQANTRGNFDILTSLIRRHFCLIFCFKKTVDDRQFLTELQNKQTASIFGKNLVQQILYYNKNTIVGLLSAQTIDRQTD